jgi:hypothetical protein
MCIPVLMPLHKLLLSLPCASEMLGAAVEVSAKTRSRARTLDT